MVIIQSAVLVDYFWEKVGLCHVYSLPFMFDCLERVTNNFSGGLFESVRSLSITDRRPFEHEFFHRIARSFPLLDNLHVMNSAPQKHKTQQYPGDDRRKSAIIEYTHLTYLYLRFSHDDYAEQFLLNTKTLLPSLVLLAIQYEQLVRVTHNFTNEETRATCVKVKSVVLGDYSIVCSPDAYRYFPAAKVYLGHAPLDD
jgi:hypothetical protein